MVDNRVALITGGAKRVGAHIAQTLHEQGFNVMIHYHQSKAAANALCETFNQKRPHSAISVQADLEETETLATLIQHTIQSWKRLDVLVNNASTFHRVALKEMTQHTFESTLKSNLTAPYLLSIQAAPYLKETAGCIINMLDIRAQYPLQQHSAYCISKAGLVMATQSLALEWAPHIRVNGIAPGVVLWPDEVSEDDIKLQKKILNRTPLKRAGTPEDIAQAALFLIDRAPYITGQILTVDGGRSLSL